MRALVSILIPLTMPTSGRRCIGSALGQTWRQKEIIVVDHGSTDGTLAVARQFESNEVRVVRSRIRGAAARVPSAGDTANPDELKDDLEKYEHLARVGGAILRAEAGDPQRQIDFASDLFQNSKTLI